MKSPYSFRPRSYVELDGEIKAGMSGGPCLDSEMNAVGMCSKGFDFVEEEPNDSPLSYMALLWPIMGRPIDLFKTGDFPAWNLFKEGPAQAIGHGRVYVTKSGDVHISKIDPDQLKPVVSVTLPEILHSGIGFAAENARRALTQLREAIDNDDANQIHTAVRRFFWELDAAIGISLRLASSRLGVDLPLGADWDAFIDLAKQRGVDASIVDQLVVLGFSWNAPDLFDIRTFSSLARQGVLLIQSLRSVDGDTTIGRFLDSGRLGGPPIQLPSGLERFYASAQKFSQRLLRTIPPEGKSLSENAI